MEIVSQNIPSQTPRILIKELESIFFDAFDINSDSIDLHIYINNEDLSLRELSRFLLFLDQTYGRLLIGDLRSYAWHKQLQLRVKEIKQGSIEIILTTILQYVPDPKALLILYLILKYVPKVVESVAKSIESISTSKNQSEQAKLARANRKKLLAEIDRDERLTNLEIRRKRQVAELIDIIIRRFPEQSKPAIRVISGKVTSVKIKVRKTIIEKDKPPK